MKFTRKFLDGYITYEENDSYFEANGFWDTIVKLFTTTIYGTVLGVFYTVVLMAIAFVGLWLLGTILSWIVKIL